MILLNSEYDCIIITLIIIIIIIIIMLIIMLIIIMIIIIWLFNGVWFHSLTLFFTMSSQRQLRDF